MVCLPVFAVVIEIERQAICLSQGVVMKLPHHHGVLTSEQFADPACLASRVACLTFEGAELLHRRQSDTVQSMKQQFEGRSNAEDV